VKKGSAFIITIGVNANDDKRYDLRYAANDARQISSEVRRNIPANKYESVVPVSLISDRNKAGQRTENNATKKKIKAVLDTLAGRTVSKDALTGIANNEQLRQARPEDMVLIAFAGHGYADKEGVFYIVPSDIGTDNSGGLAGALAKSISSDELSLWIRDIDAGEMIMIVDACHSAAAVQGQGFKPGPMGSRGLGQLSYDKGMRILTATQADNVALELGELQHGLLTYSLINNGIIKGMADVMPGDKQLYSSEWLEFAVRDVPDLYRRIKDGEVRGILIDGAKPRSDIITFEGQKSNLNLQQPSLFDFNRRSRTYQLMSLKASQ
ncbi:MAG: caspase family protein, partial [Acidobacteria bacterium]|nr:caspase family protein [Acidobacteriota bacterium]